MDSIMSSFLLPILLIHLFNTYILSLNYIAAISLIVVNRGCQ